MSDICIITGGGSGMGLETAKLLGENQCIILCGRTPEKLEDAVNELKSLGIEAEARACDVSDRASIKELAEYAKSLGNVKTVIHSAGISRGDADKIFLIDAVGTVYANEELSKVMGEGSCILNVASMSAYMIPESSVPYQLYEAALNDSESFRAGGLQMLAQVPAEQAAGAAYTISKKFVIWYTRKMAVKLGKSGIRVVSISPGTFLTPMVTGDTPEGRKESEKYAYMGALGRPGDPVEIARMIAFMASDSASYLTGTDILYDGGVIAALDGKFLQ